MSKAKKSYRVTQPLTRRYKVGQVVKLSDAEAAKLVNKVVEVETPKPEPEPKAPADVWSN